MKSLVEKLLDIGRSPGTGKTRRWVPLDEVLAAVREHEAGQSKATSSTIHQHVVGCVPIQIEPRLAWVIADNVVEVLATMGVIVSDPDRHTYDGLAAIADSLLGDGSDAYQKVKSKITLAIGDLNASKSQHVDAPSAVTSAILELNDALAAISALKPRTAPGTFTTGDLKAESGWIKWSGGECPLPPDTVVEAEFDNGKTAKDTSEALDWPGEMWPWSIRRYRVVRDGGEQ